MIVSIHTLTKIGSEPKVRCSDCIGPLFTLQFSFPCIFALYDTPRSLHSEG